jgi:hypothetical protein
MSTTTTPTGAQVRLPGRGGQARRVLAWVLLAGWIYVLAAIAVTGERDASWQLLSESLAAGEVGQVTVVGSLESYGSSDSTTSGSARVEILWRDHTLVRRTEVRQQVGQDHTSADGLHDVQASVDEVLHRIDPGLRITSEQHRDGVFMNALGVTLHGRAAQAAFVLGLATLFLLVLGPEPERATRWAWFWLASACPPLGCMAYLVLGGILKRFPTPRPRRLTGGWAFLISLVLGAGSNAS